jgi:hypothetical protein
MTLKSQDATRAKIIKKLETLNGVGEEIAGALYDAGYRSPQQVRIAPDADLIGIAGIGEHNLAKIRAKDTATTKRKVGRREIEWNPHIGGPVLTVVEPMATAEDAGVAKTADAVNETALPLNDGESTLTPARTTATEPVSAPLSDVAPETATIEKSARKATDKK